MRKYLVVIDMQNDFINGLLGTDEAMKIVPNVVDKIKNNTYYDIIATMDTHFLDEYPRTLEGKKLPVNHCIIGTEGHNIQKDVYNALADKKAKFFTKKTFGSVSLAKFLYDRYVENKDMTIEICGLCTDICVISNALLFRAYMPNVKIVVDEKCCAGTTLENHNAALITMNSCQIDVINSKIEEADDIKTEKMKDEK